MIAVVFCIMAVIPSVSIARYFLGQPTGSRSGSTQRRPLIGLWIGATAIAFGLSCGVYYLIAFNRYVVVDFQNIAGEARPIRIVIGTELRGDLENARERPLQLLQEHGYDAESVWTRDSILNARFRVFASFVATFVFLTAGLALLATITLRRAAGRRDPRPDAPATASTVLVWPRTSGIWRLLRRRTRIFLSYASERQTIADEIFLRLTGAGYEVFFAQQHAQPGTSFDTRISRSVSDCDLMVFLISRESVGPDHFCLTELNRARRRWSHPDGHVLPVNLDGTPHEMIPTYLAAVTVMNPVGNLASEVVDAVGALRARQG